LATDDPVNGLKALLKLEKPAFEEAMMQVLKEKDGEEIVKSENLYFTNDIYNKLFVQFNVEDFNKIQCDFIYPAP
jgi:m7GpppX diphosphatase